MHRFASLKSVPAVLLIAGSFAHDANAFTQPVTFNVLNASATLPDPFGVGDNLRLDTLVTTQTGALLQSITFTVSPGVDAFFGEAAWEISTASSTAPRLVGVNIDLFNSANVLVGSDSFAGVLGGFAVSTLAGSIGPGIYRLVATGTGIRASSLDITVGFISEAPEPHSLAMMLSGLGVLGFLALRRR